MFNKVFCIHEEFFSEDLNDSQFYILDDLAFTSVELAEQYLIKHCNENEYYFFGKVADNFKEHRYVAKDESFPYKYDGKEGNNKEKDFYIEELKVYKESQ